MESAGSAPLAIALEGLPALANDHMAHKLGAPHKKKFTATPRWGVAALASGYGA